MLQITETAYPGLTASFEKSELVELFSLSAEELVHHRFELPGFSRFVRIAISARTQVNEVCYEKVKTELLEVAQRTDQAFPHNQFARIDNGKLILAATIKSEVFNQLAKEGYDITPKTLQAFAPYRTEHINRFGSYSTEG